MTMPQQLDPERVGKLAAQAAALAGADLAYQLAVSQETLVGAVEHSRQLQQQLEERDEQLAGRDAELARLHRANALLNDRIREAEAGVQSGSAPPEDPVPASSAPEAAAGEG